MRRPKQLRRVVFSILIGLAVMMVGQGSPSEAQSNHSPSYAQLMALAQQHGIVPVVIGLRAAYLDEANLSKAAIASQRSALAQARANVVNQLAGTQYSVTANDWVIPYMALAVDATALQMLLASPDVTSIAEDTKLQGSLIDSTGIVGATVAWARGYDGTGYSVAVIDTGSDLTHPFFASKIIGEACYSAVFGGSEQSLCPNGQQSQTGTGSSASCTGNYSGTSCSHGSHVAGTVLGSNVSFSGVAPGAKLISIQSFTRNNGAGCSPTPCNYVYWSSVVSGMNYVYINRESFSAPPVAVNLSLQDSSNYTSSCDANYQAFTDMVNTLRAVGIATVVAAGNFSYTTGVTYPACISSVITVGSTEKNDTVASYSNSSNQLEIWAPGSAINSSVIGGGYEQFWGTSMAAPHLAGAWAIIRQAVPNASVDEVLALLQASGVNVTDPRNSVTKPRLQVENSLKRLDNIGIFRDGVFMLRNSTLSGLPDTYVLYGESGDVPLVGDWDGNGSDTPGIFRDGIFMLKNDNTNGLPDIFAQYGLGTDQPVVGDWDGNGTDTIGIFRDGVFMLSNSHASGLPDIFAQFGIATDLPLVGDWDGNGTDTIGVFRDGVFMLKNDNTSGLPDLYVQYGTPTDTPIVGDWDGNGTHTPGIFRNGVFMLRNSNTSGLPEVYAQYGTATDVLLIGKWNGAMADQNNAPVFQPSR